MKFLAAGLPSFILAVPLNALLVEVAGLQKALAYALVLVFQVTLNFFMCRHFVFQRGSPRSLWQDFAIFFTGILFFRMADWALYSVLVQTTGLYYLVVQVMNVFLFAALKFLFSEKVLEG